MDDKTIYNYAKQFYLAMDSLRDSDVFKNDDVFRWYPRGCCGNIAELLAKYLLSKGIETVYVWGKDKTEQSHAWLVIKDEHVQETKKQEFYTTNNVMSEILILPDNNRINDKLAIREAIYTEADVQNDLIVDIGGTWLSGIPVYVGYKNKFYEKFSFETAHSFKELAENRLFQIYQAVLENMQ